MGPPPLPPVLESAAPPPLLPPGTVLRALPVVEYLDPRVDLRSGFRRMFDALLLLVYFIAGFALSACVALLGFVVFARGIMPQWRGDYAASRLFALAAAIGLGYLAVRSEARRTGVAAGIWTGLALSSPLWIVLLYGLVRYLVVR